MSAKHLGERIHDLLDQRLSRADTYAAMDHLAVCEECSDRWTELRTARAALNSSEAGIDMRFAQQLLDRERMAQIAQGETKHRARAASRQRRRPVTLVAASVAVFCAAVGAAYVAGAPDSVTLEFAEGYGSTNTQSVAFHGPDSMRAGDQLRSWVHPDWEDSGIVPVEAKVVRASNGANVLVASMVADMQPIVVTEQHGRLVDALMREAPKADVEGVTAYVVSEDPLQVVWQAGDVVISASCECAVGTLEDVVEAFPVDHEPGFTDRVATGLGEFADTLSGN